VSPSHDSSVRIFRLVVVRIALARRVVFLLSPPLRRRRKPFARPVVSYELRVLRLGISFRFRASKASSNCSSITTCSPPGAYFLAESIGSSNIPSVTLSNPGRSRHLERIGVTGGSAQARKAGPTALPHSSRYGTRIARSLAIRGP